jgi:hormone-sensitive lipase
MDGLLNIHTLLMCLDSYTETQDDPLDIHVGNPQVSPWHATDAQLARLPPLFMAACELDPLLDDSVALATRVKGLIDKGERKASLDFTVLQGCPHGFLNLLGCGDAYVERAERTVFELLSIMLNATKSPRKRWRL